MRLTPTSYIVLGLVELAGVATPYELKTMVNDTVGNFWTLQHAQLYTEPERLTEGGYLTEERELTGRRRKRYSITDAGRAALKDWRSEPTSVISELREPGMLKLFFGADPLVVAPTQLEAHRGKLAELEAMCDDVERSGLAGPGLVLEAGIAHEREWVRFWSKIVSDGEARTAQAQHKDIGATR